MIRILFCNISYLPYYNTRLDRVAPKNGGAYVAKMHDAYEKHNFEECADGQYRGFVETKYRIGYEEGIATNTYNSLHIERIDPFAKGKTYAENEYDQLIGIRYFSCASNKASDMGFNYVFPTSGKQKSSSLPYCSVLAKSFYLSKPVYVHEFEYLYECERYLRDLRDFAFIDS